MADTVTAKLVQARENYADQLVALSNPEKRKVSYTVDGRSMTWTEYQKFLMDSIDQLDKAIAQRQAGEIGDGRGYVATSTHREPREPWRGW